MLAARHSLRSRKLINKAKREGKLVQSKNFGSLILKRDDDDCTRFAFIISTKVSKLSVQRNRIKRAISEQIRQSTTSLKNGYDVLFLAKTSLADMMTDQIMTEVREFMKKNKLVD